MNTSIIVPATVIVLFLIVFGANVLIYKMIRRRALKLYIIPFFKTKRQEVSEARFAGLFDGGNYGKYKFQNS